MTKGVLQFVRTDESTRVKSMKDRMSYNGAIDEFFIDTLDLYYR